MMTAPLPPAKIAPVMAKKRKMYSLCWKRRLKTKLNAATARIDAFRNLMCSAGAKAFFRRGMTTSWMKMQPQEWR